MSLDPRCYVIRGEPLAGIDRKRCRRLLYKHEDGTPPTFREVPRRWVILDFDDPPGPYRFDPRDGMLAAIYCRSLLPPEWQRCSFWWALSSSAGFKAGVRIKLAFWLDRAATWRELERILAGCPIDASTLRPVQPIFVARPILVGVADPIRERSGLEEDIHDAVPLPERRRGSGAGRAAILSPAGRRYVSGDSPTAGGEAADALCARNRAGRRRRPASVPDLGCGAGGGTRRCLAARIIAGELIAAARRAGLEDSDPDLQRQVRNGFRLGIFGPEAAERPRNAAWLVSPLIHTTFAAQAADERARRKRSASRCA